MPWIFGSVLGWTTNNDAIPTGTTILDSQRIIVDGIYDNIATADKIKAAFMEEVS
jgi:hypothetical protein